MKDEETFPRGRFLALLAGALPFLWKGLSSGFTEKSSRGRDLSLHEADFQTRDDLAG